MPKGEDTGYRNENYRPINRHRAGETNVEATYEYTSGNSTGKRRRNKK